MALTVSRQTERLNLPTTLPGVSDGDWVEILTVYTGGMRRRIMRRTLNITADVTSDTRIDVDAFASRQAVLEEIIVRWSDADEPVTPEAIEAMHPEVQDWIADCYDRLVAGRTKEETESLVDASSPTSGPEEALSPASLGIS